MLSPSALRLFNAVKRSLVNRNTALHILEQSNAPSIISGAFVRVLIEMPSEQQDYILARIASIRIGEPYSGFAPDVSRQCKWYLILQLPPELANINGVEYQLNSVSNGELHERDFARWLTFTRESGNGSSEIAIPSLAELDEIGHRIQAYYVPPLRSGVHNNNNNVNNIINNNNNYNVLLHPHRSLSQGHSAEPASANRNTNQTANRMQSAGASNVIPADNNNNSTNYHYSYNYNYNSNASNNNAATHGTSNNVALNMNYGVNIPVASAMFPNSSEYTQDHGLTNNNNNVNNAGNMHRINFSGVNASLPSPPPPPPLLDNGDNAFTQTNRLSGQAIPSNRIFAINNINNSNITPIPRDAVHSRMYINEVVNTAGVENNRVANPSNNRIAKNTANGATLGDAATANNTQMSNNNNNATSNNTSNNSNAPSGPAAQAFWRDAAERVEESVEAEEDRLDREEVMAEFREGHVLFPKSFANIKLNMLRTLEKDLNDYLQRVREELSSRREGCVICACREPTIILWPCKHKVLCRLCAIRWNACPVCRSEVKEMFEVAELERQTESNALLS